MREQLVPFQRYYGFSLNIVDVDADDYLKLRYGERVPVLVADDQELCHFFLNEDIVVEYFKSLWKPLQ
jgi:hypothetical protein